MTTEYSVKRCKSFGFAQSIREAAKLFSPDDYEKANVYYVHSSKEEMSKTLEKIKSNKLINITSVNDIQPTNDTVNNNILFVELGVKTTKTIKEPVEYDDIELVKSVCEQMNVADDFEHAILTIISNPDEAQELKEHKFSNEFLQFIIDLYPHL